MSGQAELDPKLFAEAPVRDPRFTVVDRWKECRLFPDGHPEKEVEFFHRQMHEELNSVENAARNLADFPEADWEIRMWIARQCSDEARHVLMFRRIFERRGGTLGQYPVMSFQYRICTKIDTLIGRLAVQNRSFEAGGIDAVKVGIDDAWRRGDTELAELYESQGADEIVHVRFANEWIRQQVAANPRNGLRMAAALTHGSRAFAQVMGEEAVQGIDYAADQSGRLEAGFDAAEVKQVYELSEARRLENLARKRPGGGS
ncbi:MAG: DUF455 family protein [Acidobacteria bacterium]|nr:DUF455 family protein [Acidobacteriota bacterium]